MKLFFDAIASPSTYLGSYPYQSVGEWLIVSDLEIAIASPSFASLFCTGWQVFAKCCCLAVAGGVWCHLQTIETAARQNLVTWGSKSDQATVFCKERNWFISCALKYFPGKCIYLVLEYAFIWLWNMYISDSETYRVSLKKRSLTRLAPKVLNKAQDGPWGWRSVQNTVKYSLLVIWVLKLCDSRL